MRPQVGRRHAVWTWAWTIAAVVTTLVWVSSGWWEVATPSFGRHKLFYGYGRFGHVREMYPDLYIPWTSGRNPFMKPGFRLYLRYEMSDWVELKEWQVPAWPIPLVLSIIAALHWRRAIIAARVASAHLCPRCRYDLRATPRELPCPECGNIRPA